MSTPQVPQRPEPVEPESLDGAVLLDKAEQAFRTYTVQPSDAAYVALAVYCLYTHSAGLMEFAPRLVVTSAEKQSGKSRTMEVVTALAGSPLQIQGATPPALFRYIDKCRQNGVMPTIVFDESDTVFGPDARREDAEPLRGLFNSGFASTGCVLRAENHGATVTKFSTFAPVALAGIHGLPDTITDRAVNIRLRRRKNSETVHPYRLRTDGKRLEAVGAQMAKWSVEHREEISNHYAAGVPTPFVDRAADVWEPLFTVADVVGGEWPDKIRVAARELVATASEAAETISPGLQLLTDVQHLFSTGVLRAGFIYTESLLHNLYTIEESPWRDQPLTASDLASLLKPYGIRSRRDSAGNKRGYKRAAFLDAMERYLTPTPGEASEASDTSETLVASENVPPGSLSGGATPTERRQTPKLRQDTLSDASDGSDALTGVDKADTSQATTPTPSTQRPTPASTPTQPGRCPLHGFMLIAYADNRYRCRECSRTPGEPWTAPNGDVYQVTGWWNADGHPCREDGANIQPTGTTQGGLAA